MPEEVNHPETVAELRDAFARYNAALEANDVDALNQFFWSSEHTVRFGPRENHFGYAEIARFRSTSWKGSPVRRLAHVVITTFGHDFGTTNAVFAVGDNDALSRQSQTWARFPDGWRIVAAHVSPIPAPRHGDHRAA